MITSRDAYIRLYDATGLAYHIFKFNHPLDRLNRDGFIASYPLEWCPVYWHKADAHGVCFRPFIPRGTDAVGQYPEPSRSLYDKTSRHALRNISFGSTTLSLELQDDIEQHPLGKSSA